MGVYTPEPESPPDSDQRPGVVPSGISWLGWRRDWEVALGESGSSVQPWGGIEIIDTMMNYPDPSDQAGQHDNPLFAKRGAILASGDPAGYMLEEMDRYKISTAVINLGPEGGAAEGAVHMHAKRFIATYAVDPNRGMDAVRDLEHAVKKRGARAAYIKPALLTPQVPINDRMLYPIYAKCVELDIPVFVLTGVPGPRVPSAPQKVELIDDVCWYFPDLKFVMRHGGEPWEDMAVKLMVRRHCQRADAGDGVGAADRRREMAEAAICADESGGPRRSRQRRITAGTAGRNPRGGVRGHHCLARRA
jgi:hypothetical protein